jgi:hypothetical protein
VYPSRAADRYCQVQMVSRPDNFSAEERGEPYRAVRYFNEGRIAHLFGQSQ